MKRSDFNKWPFKFVDTRIMAMGEHFKEFENTKSGEIYQVATAKNVFRRGKKSADGKQIWGTVEALEAEPAASPRSKK